MAKAEYETTGRLYKEIISCKKEFERTWGNVVNLTEDQYLAYAAWDVITSEIENSKMDGNEQRTLMLSQALITIHERTCFTEAEDLVESRIGQYVNEQHVH